VDAAAVWIASAIGSAVQATGGCSISLAGGSTPRPLYERLATESGLRWDALQVYFGDERCVPPDHPDSNYRMARESLLTRVPIPESNVHRMEADAPDVDVSARAYERILPLALDLLVLGMGADGHTASLFPNSPALEERMRRVVLVRPETQSTPRLTITAPVIEQSRRIVVLVFGGEKAGTLARVFEGPVRPRELPVQLARGAVWFADRAAAGRLTTG